MWDFLIQIFNYPAQKFHWSSMKMKRLITKSTSLLLAWALESRPERTRTLARIVKTVTRLQIWANCWKWFTYIVRHASSGKKNTFLPFLCCCTADAQIGAGIHQLYNNVSLVHFLTACRHAIVVHLRQKYFTLGFEFVLCCIRSLLFSRSSRSRPWSHTPQSTITTTVLSRMA